MINDLQQQLGIDQTFFIQFVVFFVLFLWLKFIFFRPFLQLIQSREASTQGLGEKSRELEKQSAQLEIELSAARVEAKKAAGLQSEKTIQGTQTQVNEILVKAKALAKEHLEKERAQNESSLSGERESLRAQTDLMVVALCDKLLQKKKASF